MNHSVTTPSASGVVQFATVGLHVHRQPGSVGRQVRRRREIQVKRVPPPKQRRHRVVDAEMPEGAAAAEAADTPRGRSGPRIPTGITEVSSSASSSSLPRGQRGAPDRRGVGGTGGGVRRHRPRLVAGPRLREARDVRETHPHPQLLAVVVASAQREARPRRPEDVAPPT